jgi:hypothetical protein
MPGFAPTAERPGAPATQIRSLQLAELERVAAKHGFDPIPNELPPEPEPEPEPKARGGAAPSTVREVYVKEAKNRDPGLAAVRKIVVVHREDPGFARYTVHWTDFSPGRKDPLQTETRIAETPERLAELLDAYRVEGGKRGWMLV